MIVIRLGNIMLEQKTEASEMGESIYDQEYLNFVSMVIVTLAHPASSTHTLMHSKSYYFLSSKFS